MVGLGGYSWYPNEFEASLDYSKQALDEGETPIREQKCDKWKVLPTIVSAKLFQCEPCISPNLSHSTNPQ